MSQLNANQNICLRKQNEIYFRVYVLVLIMHSEIYVSLLYIHIYMYICIYMLIYIYMYIYIVYICINIYICIYK